MNDRRCLRGAFFIPLIAGGISLLTLAVRPPALQASDAIVAADRRASAPGDVTVAQAPFPGINNAAKGPGAAQIVRKSQTLADADRYQLLKNWVMPDRDCFKWRLTGIRLSADEVAQPYPHAVRALKTVTMAHRTTLASPAFELIDAAIQNGRLKELQQAIDAEEPPDQLGRRNQLALQILVAVAAKDDSLAKSKLIDQLILIKASEPGSFPTRDPEQLTIIGLLDRSEWLLAAKSLVMAMWDKNGGNYKQVTPPGERSMNDTIDKKIAELPSRSEATRPRPEKLGQWQFAPMDTARTRAAGTNSAVWSLHRGVARVNCGERPSPLFFQSPLVGDFEVTCDISTTPYREGSVAYAMFGVCPYWDQSGIYTLPVLGRAGKVTERLQFPRWDSSADVRVVVNNGQLVNYVNGVKIHSTELPPVPDLWLVLQTFNAWFSTSVRNVRITGTPSIPEYVNLSEVTDLVNWRADYFDERVGQEADPAAQWFQNEDEIVSRTRTQNGSGSPGLLLHQRPLSFDGELTCEFFYEPGKYEIHPALGQTVWLLSAGQVQARRLSDFSPNRVAATDTVPMPAKPLTTGLLPNNWNTIRLTMKDARVTLSVNGTKVDEMSLDETNTRQFALFRPAGVSGSRVRAVKWRGDWPKKLPTVNDQELAVPADGLFAQKAWPMTGKLKLDTSLEELRDLTFSTNANDDRYTETSDGIELSLDPQRSGGGVTELAWRHVLRGDFDITVIASKIHLASKNSPEVCLRLNFDDEVRSGLAVIVGQNHQGRDQIMSDHIRHPADGSYWFERWERHLEVKSGRLRIAREGGLAYLFYAANDDEFHLLTTYAIGNADVKSVSLWTQIHGPDGNLQAAFKELTINAEEIVD